MYFRKGRAETLLGKWKFEASRKGRDDDTTLGWDNAEEAAYPHLREVLHPVLVASGNHDLVIPTVNAFVLAQRLPNAQLIIYPDSGHGFLFQYHTLFGKHATLFLDV